MPRATPHPDPDASLAPLSAADIQHQTDTGSFSRGRSYFRNGHILQPIRRDADIEAQCLGSDPAPYHVRATLARANATGENPVATSCSCPRGGFCKHIVAMLLAWIDDPDRFAQRPPVTEQVAERSREELIALIDRMVLRHPDLEVMLDPPLPLAPGPDAGPPNEATVDEKAVRRQVRSALAEVSDAGDGWGWGGGVSLPHELTSLVELGQRYVAAGQWANAVVVLAAMMEEFVEEAEEWMFSHDEEGEFLAILIACDAGLAACLDAQPGLPEPDRLHPHDRAWAIEAIYRVWQYDVFDDGGGAVAQVGPESLIRNATAEERATIEGWLGAERDHQPSAEPDAGQRDGYRRAIIGFIADLREAGGADADAILDLYREAELWDDLAAMLLRVDRVDEAIVIARRHVRIAPRLTSFATALIAHDTTLASRAIALVDDLAWEMEGANAAHDATLEEWLITRYSQHDRPREALKLAERRFRRRPDLPAYLGVERVAGLVGDGDTVWNEVRPALHAHLREQQAWAVLVDVGLHDGDVAAALHAHDALTRQRPEQRSGTWAPMAWSPADRDLRLARAAEEDFPDRAVDVYRLQAERAIERRQRASYQIAAQHLVRARETLKRHGRDGDGTALIADIRERNRTLRALREELDNAGL